MTSKITRGPLAAAVAAALGSALLPIAASAASAVPAASAPQLTGTVAAYDGKYALRVENAAGKVEPVQLHQGTIINPTGLTLQPGMKVSILGSVSNGELAAQEIDTPYHITQAAYAPAGGYGGYGYGGFGPYGYGFGPYAAYGVSPFYGGPAFGFGF